MLTMSAKTVTFIRKLYIRGGVGGRPVSTDRWLTEGVGGSEIPKCWLTSYLDGSLKYPSRGLRKVSVVSPLVLLSHDEIGGQKFLPEDPECVLECPKQFLWTL